MSISKTLKMFQRFYTTHLRSRFMDLTQKKKQFTAIWIDLWGNMTIVTQRYYPKRIIGNTNLLLIFTISYKRYHFWKKKSFGEEFDILTNIVMGKTFTFNNLIRLPLLWHLHWRLLKLAYWWFSIQNRLIQSNNTPFFKVKMKL